MSDRIRPGIPDLWVSGKKSDLWIEVKFDTKTKGPIKPKLSATQLNWINNRYDEGRNVIVIVGTSLSDGIIYTDKAWEIKLPNSPVPFKDIVDFIKDIAYE